jgi:outer membrane protein TolC
VKKFILPLVICFCFVDVSAQKSLDFYLQSAIANSPVFIDNQNQIQSLALDSMLIRAGYKPQINFSSNNVYAPVVNGYGYDEINTNGGSYNALLGANYTIVGKERLNNRFSSINIQKQILELNAKLTERDLRQTVTAQYITVYGEQQVLKNAQSVLDVLEKENFVLKSLAEKGVYRQTDYLSFLVNYKQQQLAFGQQKLQTQNDLYFLNYLCGIADTTYIILNEPTLSLNAIINSEQSLQFNQYLLDSLQIKISKEQIKFNYRPHVNLFGDAGYSTTFIYHAEKNFGASVGLNFSVPIYDGNQRKLQIEKFKLSENSRQNFAGFFRKQFSMKQIQLQQQISETGKLISEARQQLEISDALVKANNKLLETGDAKIADYILSLTGYISSAANVLQLNANKIQLINQYNYLNY